MNTRKEWDDGQLTAECVGNAENITDGRRNKMAAANENKDSIRMVERFWSWRWERSAFCKRDA